MEESLNAVDLNAELSLLEVELAKKELKLKRQKRYAVSRKRRLGMVNSLITNTTDQPRTEKSAKCNYNVSTVIQSIDSEFLENIDINPFENSLSLKTQKDWTCFDNRNEPVESCSDKVLATVKSADVETITNENQLGLFNNVSEDNLQRSERNSEELLLSSKGLNSDMCNKNSDANSADVVRTVLKTKTVDLPNENGKVFFCEYSTDTIVIVQECILSVFVLDLDSDKWSIAYQYKRKSFWCFSGGYLNTGEDFFVELNLCSRRYDFVEVLVVLYGTRDFRREQKMVLCTLPRSPLIMIQCFTDGHVALCYQLQADSLSRLVCWNVKKTQVYNMAQLSYNVTSLNFLRLSPESTEVLLATSDAGACYLYNVWGDLLQSYTLQLVTESCLFVNLEKNILFLVFLNKTEKVLLLVALNLLNKQHHVIQKYQLASILNVADLRVFIKEEQLVALNKDTFTSWAIKTGTQTSTWSLAERGEIFLHKDQISFVNNGGDKLSLLSLL